MESLDDVTMGSSKNSPLVTAEDFDENPTQQQYGSIDNATRLEDIPDWTIKEKVVTVLAGISAVFSVFSIILFLANPLVIMTGLFGILIPAYSSLQQQKITESEALKETNESLDRELLDLKLENDRLEDKVARLEGSVSSLQDMEDTLVVIQKDENAAVGKLQSQLEKSRNILNDIETNTMGIVIQNIVSVVLSSDKDGDFLMNQNEIDSMIIRIERIQGVEINDGLFKKKIMERGNNVDAVINLIKDLLDDDSSQKIPGNNMIITIL